MWCWKGEIIAPESKNETKQWPNIETPTQEGEDKKSERENENDKEQLK